MFNFLRKNKECFKKKTRAEYRALFGEHSPDMIAEEIKNAKFSRVNPTFMSNVKSLGERYKIVPSMGKDQYPYYMVIDSESFKGGIVVDVTQGYFTASDTVRSLENVAYAEIRTDYVTEWKRINDIVKKNREILYSVLATEDQVQLFLGEYIEAYDWLDVGHMYNEEYNPDRDFLAYVRFSDKRYGYGEE